MKALDAIVAINDLAASQHGLFTTAQARAAGVDRLAVARLAARGQIDRVGHGVYRAGGAPSARAEDVLAAWMELEPGVPTYLRDKGPDGFTASLNTAAWLHGIGELNPTPLSFSHPRRRQTRKAGLAFIRRELDPADIVVVSGVPATSVRRTVIDLIDYGEDLSLVANVLADARGLMTAEEEASLRDEANEHARGRGQDVGLLDRLWGSDDGALL